MREPKDVIDELNSWKNVADELEKRGIKGERESCYACPVARFLVQETGYTVDVNAYWVDFISPNDVDVMTFDVSADVHRFIINFDDGEYPDLDEYPIDNEQDEY